MMPHTVFFLLICITNRNMNKMNRIGLITALFMLLSPIKADRKEEEYSDLVAYSVFNHIKRSSVIRNRRG